MRSFVAFIVLAFGLSRAAVAQSPCSPPPEIRQQMDALVGTNPPLGLFNRGLDHLDRQCFDEAIGDFDASRRLLATKSNPLFQERSLLDLATSGLGLARAVQRLRAGDRTAVNDLRELARTSIASQVKLRIVLVLAPLLDANAPAAAAIEEDLRTLAATGFWQAQKALAWRAIARGEASRAIAELERRLATSERLQDAHAAAILLADVYGAAGRTLEAWLLVRRIDSDVGEEVLDPSLRVEYLRVAAVVARAAGGDADAAAAVRTYQAALQEVMHP